jgi:hypothetical protein
LNAISICHSSINSGATSVSDVTTYHIPVIGYLRLALLFVPLFPLPGLPQGFKPFLLTFFRFSLITQNRSGVGGDLQSMMREKRGVGERRCSPVPSELSRSLPRNPHLLPATAFLALRANLLAKAKRISAAIPCTSGGF